MFPNTLGVKVNLIRAFRLVDYLLHIHNRAFKRQICSINKPGLRVY